MLWGMRTGKTRTVIKTAEKIQRYDDLAGVLVMAPNGVHSNWVRRELPQWASSHVGAYWNSNQSRERDPRFLEAMNRMLNGQTSGLRWFAVNDEALINPRAHKAIQEFRRACRDRILLVADESSLFRRPGARRTQLIRGLARKFPYRRILDGTAIFNSPLHAFSQYEILEKGALGFDTYKRFQDRYAVYVRKRRGNFGREFPMLDHYQNMDELRERMGEWSSVVMREDCDDMPELIRYPREVAMSDAQRKAYRQMVEQMLVEIGDQEISAVNGGARVLKLQQILGGFVMDRGEVVNIDDRPPILDALEEQVLGVGGKTIVWCRFREDIRRVVHRLRAMGRNPVEYHGGVSQGAARERAVDGFMTDKRVTDLVGQPQAGGRGLNLSAARAIIWYSCTPDAIITAQGDERGTMMGGHAVDIITLATTGTVHDDIVRSNEGKVLLADSVSGRGLRDMLLRTDV